MKLLVAPESTRKLTSLPLIRPINIMDWDPVTPSTELGVSLIEANLVVKPSFLIFDINFYPKQFLVFTVVPSCIFLTTIGSVWENSMNSGIARHYTVKETSH